MFWFTSDEHYGHKNIIEYCKRPFSNTDDMDNFIIEENNKLVKSGDFVIHAGDFTLISNKEVVYKKYISRLIGNHIFLRGSHDNWLPASSLMIWERTIEKFTIVVCHYAMRTWKKSHYNSWQLYGHSHGNLEPIGKQWDIGVDNNNFKPLSFDELVEIMKNRPDNPNLVKNREY